MTLFNSTLKKLNAFSAVIATILIVTVTALFLWKVDLEPKVTPDFFFSSDSEIFKKNQTISDVFPSQQQVMINVTTGGNIEDPAYIEKIEIITERIQNIDGITDVQSVTNGPSSLDAARENPLWRRLLIGEGEDSTFIIAFTETQDFKSLVKELEEITVNEKTATFNISISGLPYIVEQIRRNLTNDMKTFTLGAVVLSAIVLLLVFRSPIIVVGALLACITAALLTLTVQSFMGIPIGILTANLGTIVFVLTLSHIIFLSSNWYSAEEEDNSDRLNATTQHTLPASFWAALTTLLGFVSLIFVEAKPLNQLGTGGTIGAIAALVCAYLIFPAFLKRAKVSADKTTQAIADNLPTKRSITRAITIAVVGIAGVVGVLGISTINTDPSLLTYFDEESELYKGIYYVDENGGSNPLLLVVRRDDAVKLDNNESYEKMWALQNSLAAHDSVGSVISLPIIMAEGDEHWLGQFLPWDTLLDILSNPKFGAIANSFVTPDRVHAMYLVRMKENGRERTRLTIIEEIEKIPPQNGFAISAIGGTYYLQGELAASVARSMTTGIATLILIFGVVAYIVSRSMRVVAGVVICAATISALVLGTLGLLGAPVDIISSPAINICLGLIVDDMIHLTVTAKRYIQTGKAKSMRDWNAWKAALDTQSWPAIISTLTIIIGFSVFALSDFPPSQRFGIEIAYGAGLAVILALIVFPFIVAKSTNPDTIPASNSKQE